MAPEQLNSPEECIKLVPPMSPEMIADALMRIDPIRFALVRDDSAYGMPSLDYFVDAVKNGNAIVVGGQFVRGGDCDYAVIHAGNCRGNRISELHVSVSTGQMYCDEDAIMMTAVDLSREELFWTIAALFRNQTNTVYGILHPETRSFLGRVDKKYDWQKLIDFTPGRVQDKIQRRYLSLARAWCTSLQVVLGEGFPIAHFTAGANEAIKNLLCAPFCRVLHVFDGEYEGARAEAEARGAEVVVHRWDDLEEVVTSFYGPNHMFYISAPSAIDGEYQSELPSLLERMQETHPEVKFVIDIVYTALVKKTELLDVSEYGNVEAVTFSLSKAYGAYYERIGGVFLRHKHDTFGGVDWFKNTRSIVIGMELLERAVGCDRQDDETPLPQRWAEYQQRAFDLHRANGLLPPEARLSNAFLLATSLTPPEVESFNGFPTFSKRGDVYRYCLAGTMFHLMAEDQRRALQEEEERHA